MAGHRELSMTALDRVSGGDLGGLSCLLQLASAVLEGAGSKTTTATPVSKQTAVATSSAQSVRFDVASTRIADRLR